MSPSNNTSSLATLTPFLTSTIRKPESFFVPQPEITTEALNVTKILYDLARAHEPEPFSPLPELITAGMDHEQIWAELELRNGPLLKFVKKGLKELKKLLAEEEDENEDKEQVAKKMTIDNEDNESESVERERMESENSRDIDYNDEILELEDLKGRLKRKSEVQQDKSEEDLSEEEIEDDDLEQDGSEDLDEALTKSVRTSEVDDDFFKLTEFNTLTEQFETQDMRSEDEEDEENRIDFDMDPDDIESEKDDNEDGWDEGSQTDAADILYKDFFEPPSRSKTIGFGKRQHKNKGMGDEGKDKRLKENKQQQKSDLFDDDGDEHMNEEEDWDGDEDESEDNAGEKSRKSKEELRMDKVRREIEKLEADLVAEKNWTLAGETSSRARPINSLLEEDLEFDHAVKPVPIITAETTETLEDMIRQRILDNKYDDVQRKRNPESRAFVPSKMIELSDEKSKKSLAEIYEEDYLKHSATVPQMHEKDAELLQKHKEIDDMFKALCVKLDALSNFHFTPKPPKPEITVVSDVPAISMEEAIPIHVSDATLLAPEEVYEPPKEGAAAKGKSEMDSMDKKRAVRSRKRARKAERTMRERERKAVEKLNPGMGNKHAKEKAISSLVGKKNITFIDKEGNKKAALKSKDKVLEMHSSKLKL